MITIDKNSYWYRALKWAYQPIKFLKAMVRRLWYIPRRQALIRKFAAHDFAGLHIGCGPFRFEGWMNTDLPPNSSMDFPLDISRPLPLPDHYFHALYASEVIEHIPLDESRTFLQEAFRVLRPGGVFRLTTPDIENLCRIFLHQHAQITPAEFGPTWLEGEFSEEIWLNAMFRAWGHQFIYSFASLQKEMEAAGFSKIIRVKPQLTESSLPQLNNLEIRYGENPPGWRFEDSMLVEAYKPT